MGELAEVRKMADRPLNELLSRDMVDIYVGSESTHWILHEKLLCARSSFFRKTFYTSPTSRKSSSTSSSSTTSDDTPDVKPSTDDKSPATKSVGLPDDDDSAFQAFVAWLYAAALPPAAAEADLTVLLELYLMSERWGVPALQARTLEAVRGFYRDTDTYPGLRRVQYVYAYTSEGSAMREFLVGSVARMLVLGEKKGEGKGGMPLHWEKALRKNGVLAVDLIGKVREWGLDARRVPDVRREDEGAGVEEEEEEEDVESEDGEEVKQEDEEDEEEEPQKKQIRGEGDDFNQNALDKELPNGLTNGV